MVKLKEVMHVLESFAPPSLQEDYDNSGLIIHSGEEEIKGILITLDVTSSVMEEAIKKNANLIIAHHPLIFRGLKKIDDNSDSGRAIRKAIVNNIHIYAIHTNLDNIRNGVNGLLASKLKLEKTKVLQPRKNTLSKLVTFCPADSSMKVLEALHEAGAGIIGNYDHCSFRSSGIGTYRPNDMARPYAGEAGKLEEADEERIEVQFPDWLENQVLEALRNAHPYEEVAYFIQKVNNISDSIGSGIIGDLHEKMPQKKFLTYVKEMLQLHIIKHTVPGDNRQISSVALCGGAGSFLISKAISSGADAFITSDIKYHDYFKAEGRLLLADIGHYESEKFTKDLLYGLINKKISNIALHLSEVNTNPVHYI